MKIGSLSKIGSSPLASSVGKEENHLPKFAGIPEKVSTKFMKIKNRVRKEKILKPSM